MSTEAQKKWDQMLEETLNAQPKYLDGRRQQREAHRLMRQHHGRRPAGLPFKIRLALWWAGKKLKNVEPTEVRMSPFVKKLVVSGTYGIGATSAVLSVALQDGSITGGEYYALLTAFVAGFWGAFKSNTTVIAPSRRGETVTKFGPR